MLANQPIAKHNTLHESPEPYEVFTGLHRATAVEFSHQFTNAEPEMELHHSSRRQGRRSSETHRPAVQGPITYTHITAQTSQSLEQLSRHTQKMYSGFGGFPMPHELLAKLLGWLFPKVKKQLHRTVTMPATTTLTGSVHGRTHSNQARYPVGPRSSTALSSEIDTYIQDTTRPVPYLTFDAIVGRNSDFRMLTNVQLEELGGVEYRALNALLWLLAIVSGIQRLKSITNEVVRSHKVPSWHPNYLLRDISTIYIDTEVVCQLHAPCTPEECCSCVVCPIKTISPAILT